MASDPVITDAARTLLEAFNGGMLNVPSYNPRGFTTFYLPEEAMAKALTPLLTTFAAAAVAESQAEIKRWRESYNIAFEQKMEGIAQLAKREATIAKLQALYREALGCQP